MDNRKNTRSDMRNSKLHMENDRSEIRNGKLDIRSGRSDRRKSRSEIENGKLDMTGGRSDRRNSRTDKGNGYSRADENGWINSKVGDITKKNVQKWEKSEEGKKTFGKWNKPERENANKNAGKWSKSEGTRKNAGKWNGQEEGRKNIGKPVLSPVKGSKKHKSVCPVADICGGCSYKEVSYEEHLAEKQKMVNNLLKSFAAVHPIQGMENPTYYRNKVHAVFDYHKGRVISGIYEESTHHVIPVDECFIEDPNADAIIRDIRGLLPSFKIQTYDEDTGYGLFRHVLIRTGYYTKQVLVVLVLASPIMPSRNNFVKALLKLHPEITSIVINVNDKKTSMVLGDKETVIYGKGYIEDKLGGCTFRISPKSFYQVNPVQTEYLYQKALELAQLTGSERVVDAYCGTGTIGILTSEKAGEVIGVELNPDAVRDAITNAKLNKRKNIWFYQKDAGEFLVQMASQGEHVDVVIMDPPRSGSSEDFIQSIGTIAPDRVVYVSCNPETLARDVKLLKKQGYRPEGFWPFDMFPWTKHVETVCLMSRKEK